MDNHNRANADDPPSGDDIEVLPELPDMEGSPALLEGMEVNGDGSSNGSVEPPYSNAPSDEMDVLNFPENMPEVNMALEDALLRDEDAIIFNLNPEENIDLANLIPAANVAGNAALPLNLAAEEAYGNPAPEDIFVDVAAQNELVGENVEEADTLEEASMPLQDPRLLLQNLPAVVLQNLATMLHWHYRKILRRLASAFRFTMILPTDMLTIHTFHDLIQNQSGFKHLRVILCEAAEGYEDSDWEWACHGGMVNKLWITACGKDVMTFKKKRTLLLKMLQHFSNADSVFFGALSRRSKCKQTDIVPEGDAEPFPEFPHVKDLTFQNCRSIYSVFAKFPHVQYLCLGEWSGSSEERTYFHLANNLPHLKSLEAGLSLSHAHVLHGCRSFENLTVAGLYAYEDISSLLRTLPKLEVLDLNILNEGVDHGELLDLLAETMPNLRCLRITANPPKDPHKRMRHVLVHKLNRLTSLVQLIVGTPHRNYRNYHSVDEIYRPAYRLRLPNLEEICVPYNWQDNEMVVLFKGCPKLTTLYALNGKPGAHHELSIAVGRPCYVKGSDNDAGFSIYPPKRKPFYFN